MPENPSAGRSTVKQTCTSEYSERLRALASGLLTAQECTRFVFGRAPLRTALGELTALPDPLAGLRGALLLRERGEGKEKSGKWKGMEREWESREEKGRGGKEIRTPPPSINFCICL